MSVAPQAVRLPTLSTLIVRDFSGGPNLREAPPELADNEVVDSWNVTYDERGGASSRLGYSKWNATAFTGAGVGAPVNVYFSEILDDVVTQAGTNLYLGTTNTVRKTFTTNGRAVFADFNGTVFAGHPVDGLFSSTDGITWTALADVDKPATAQAMWVWQNKLWVALFNSTRIQFSDAGNGLAWTPASFVDLREKDDEPIMGFAGASGVDIAGRPGLIVNKRESAYRIHDSSTGAYETIDTQVGTASNISTVSLNGRIYSLSEHGIYWTDGIGAYRPSADRFEPLWAPGQINYSNLALMCAGRLGNRLHFSMPRAGSSANDLAIELHPDQGWLAPGSNAVSCYTTYGLNTETLLGGSPTASGQVFTMYAAVGTDDGVAITSRMQTKWFEPSGGILSRMRRVRLLGRGPVAPFAMIVRRDYATTGGDSFAVSLSDVGALYDSGITYDAGALYVSSAGQNYQDFYSLGTCKAFSLLFQATTTGTNPGLALLGSGSGPTQGAWAIYGLDLLYVTLGIA